jgi:predicted ester cyclase
MRASMAFVVAFPLTFAPAHAAEVDGKQLYRNFIEEVWNKRRPSAVDEYLAPDFIEHNANLPPGRDGRKRFAAAVQAGFSDYHGEIQEIVAEGDRVVGRVVWTGTQDGPFLGRPATGNKLRFATADFFRIVNGKLAEHWDVVDSLPRAIALGLVSPPQTASPAPAAKP